jgi:hypothetical protein
VPPRVPDQCTQSINVKAHLSVAYKKWLADMEATKTRSLFPSCPFYLLSTYTLS